MLDNGGMKIRLIIVKIVDGFEGREAVEKSGDLSDIRSHSSFISQVFSYFLVRAGDQFEFLGHVYQK